MDISAHTAADDAEQQIELTKARIDSSLYYIDAIIKWLTIEEGMTRQQKTKAKLVVYVYASWCRWCEAMDSVFANKEIAHYLNQQFIPIKFNAETKTAINYRGKVYKFLPSMDDFVHELTLLLLNNKQSYPGFVVFDETGNTVDVENGYMDAIRFENYLNYHGSNVYKYSSFDDFYYDFQGRVK
jgi:thioredoxin-related protein